MADELTTATTHDETTNGADVTELEVLRGRVAALEQELAEVIAIQEGDPMMEGTPDELRYYRAVTLALQWPWPYLDISAGIRALGLMTDDETLRAWLNEHAAR